ncbi:hypothetical protein [Planktotalea sp.]|uniref:hypothetical protein n=1 Tax=Planktotalea sp. TaxID=2029877 RepID=UPI003D6A6D3E
MAKPIKIVVKGTETAGDDSPTVEDLLSQVQDQVDILKEVEGAIAGDTGSELVWRVTNVTKNSPISFEITPFPKTHGMNIDNRAVEVVAATAGGLASIASGGGRPLHFTDKVLKKINGFSKRVTNGLSGTEIDFSGYDDARNFEITPRTASQTIAEIEKIVRPATKPYREIGSIEGYVKAVGRDGFGRPVVTITTRLDRQDVKCISSDAGLDKIGHLEVGKVIKGLRIKLHGLLLYKAPSVLDHIEVERTEIFPDEDKLPSILDLIDPEFTGGKLSVDYIREGRDYG